MAQRNAGDPHSFSIAAKAYQWGEIFLSWLFKYSSRCFELKSKDLTEILENPSSQFLRFAESYRAEEGARGIICQVTSDQKDIDKTAQILELIFEKIADPKLCDLASAEVLAKVMAYRALSEGQSFFIPTMNREGAMELFPYTVAKTFQFNGATWGFGLLNVHMGQGSPILLIRGTDLSLFSEGGRISMISDLDPKGPGHTLFKKLMPEINSFLKSSAKKQGKVRVFGHSLGGVMLCYAMIELHSYINPDPHAKSYAFNFPGIAERLCEKWTLISNKSRPAFIGVVCRGDVISKFGSLFGDVYEASYPRLLPPIRAHEQLLFAEPTTYLRPVDVDRENRCDSRQFYSKLHQKTSSMIYDFGLKFLFPE